MSTTIPKLERAIELLEEAKEHLEEAVGYIRDSETSESSDINDEIVEACDKIDNALKVAKLDIEEDAING